MPAGTDHYSDLEQHVDITAKNLLDGTIKLDIENSEHRIAGMRALLEAIGEASVYLDNWTPFNKLVRTFRVYFLEDPFPSLDDFNETGLLISGPINDVPRDKLYALVITQNGHLFHLETRVRLSTLRERATRPSPKYALTAIASGFGVLTAAALDDLIRGPYGKRYFAHARRTVLELLEAMEARVLREINDSVGKARHVNQLFG